jgi:hypothetical protein
MVLLRKIVFVFVMSSACLFQLDAMESKEAVSPTSPTTEKREFLNWIAQKKGALQSSKALEYLQKYVFKRAKDEHQACSKVQNYLHALIESGFDVNKAIGNDEDKIPMNALCWFINYAVIARNKLYKKDPETAQFVFKHYVEEYVSAALSVLLEHRADPEYQLTCDDGTEIISPLVYACKIFYDTQCDESFMPVLKLLASYSSGQQVDMLAQFMSEYKASPDDPKKSKNFSNAIRTMQNVKKVVLQTKVFEVSPHSAFSRVSSSKTLSSDASQLSRVSLLSSSSSSSSLSSVSLQDTPVEIPLQDERKESVSPAVERGRSRSVNAMNTGNASKDDNCRPCSVPAIGSYAYAAS